MMTRLLGRAISCNSDITVLMCWLGRDEEHFVVHLHYGFVGGNDWAVLAEDRHHLGIDIGHMFAQRAQRLSHQRPAVVGAHAGKLHSAIGEIQHLQGAGMLQKLLDLAHHGTLGIDEHIDRHVFSAEELELDVVPIGAGEVFVECGCGRS